VSEEPEKHITEGKLSVVWNENNKGSASLPLHSWSKAEI
jgi:hypothetical protein